MIVFALILIGNAVFGIMWIFAYLGNAEWAEILVRKL